MKKKRNTKKKLTKKQLMQRKIFYKNLFITTLLLILVLGISYLIFKTDILQPRVNEVTANYISFNNKDTTDIIRINNIKKMPDDIGRSFANKKSSKLSITGEKNNRYEVIIYPIVNEIDLKYINYAIKIGDNIYSNSLDKVVFSEDDGYVVYKNSIKSEKDITIRMWVSDEYRKKVEDNSFEIKVKSR